MLKVTKVVCKKILDKSLRKEALVQKYSPKPELVKIKAGLLQKVSAMVVIKMAEKALAMEKAKKINNHQIEFYY